MKKDLKESKLWYISATHYLTSGFVIPLILSALSVFLLKSFFGTSYQAWQFLTVLIVSLLSVYLGVIYSASYLKKTYKIKDAKKIIKYSSIYFIFFSAFLFLLDSTSSIVKTYKENGFATAFWFVFFPFIYLLIASLIFYLTSKKYIKNNT